jgi:hypothetical protein
VSKYGLTQTVLREEKYIVQGLKKMGYEVEVHPEGVQLNSYYLEQEAKVANIIIPRQHLRGADGDIGFTRQPDGKPQRLRESTLQKLRDFLGMFDLRNVVDDQELKEQVQKARALLQGVSTDALRNMPLVRAVVREGMADVAAQMDLLVSDRVSRKFRFDEESL